MVLPQNLWNYKQPATDWSKPTHSNPVKMSSTVPRSVATLPLYLLTSKNRMLMKTHWKHCTIRKRWNSLVYLPWMDELTLFYHSGERWLMYTAQTVHRQHRLYCAASSMSLALYWLPCGSCYCYCYYCVVMGLHFISFK